MNEFNRKQAHSRNRQTFICTHLYFAAKVNNAICWMYCTEWYVYVRNPCANASMQCTLYIEQTYGIETKHGRKSWWYCICPKRSGVVWLKIATTKKPLRLIEITSRSQRMEIAEISPFRSILLKLVQHNRADFVFLNVQSSYMQFIIFFTSSDFSVPIHRFLCVLNSGFFLTFCDHEVDFIIAM